MENPRVDKAFSWSVSRHDTFASCRRRYFYSYYASNEDPEIKRLKKLSALPMWAGNVVHQTIENFLKTRDTLPLPEEQEALIRATVHDDMLANWRESEAGTAGFRLFEHEYETPIEQEDKRIVVNIVMRSLRAFFRSETLREVLLVGREQWLTVEDLVSFEVGDATVFLRMDLAYRNREGRVVIVDWKTGRGEGRFSEVQLAGYALYAARQGWVQEPEEIETELAYLAIPRYVRRRIDRRKLEIGPGLHREECYEHEGPAHRPRGQPGPARGLRDDRPAAGLPPMQLPKAVLPEGRRTAGARGRAAQRGAAGAPRGSALQVLREERRGARPRVLGRGLAVAAPGIVDVRERVARALVDLDVDGLARRLHRGLEGSSPDRVPVPCRRRRKLPSTGALIAAMDAGSVGGAP